MRTYPYQPSPAGIDNLWTCAADVYCYLYAFSPERDRLYNEICALKPNEPFVVQITHRLLPGDLVLSTVDTDNAFIHRLEQCLRHEMLQGRYFPPSLYVTVLPVYLQIN